MDSHAIDADLLDLIQNEFPLVPRPYAAFEETLGVAEDLVIGRPAALKGWPFRSGLGLLGGLAHLSLTQAYRLAPAPTVAAIDYTAIFWGVLFGYVIWGEFPGANLAAGAFVVISSGLYIIRRRQHPAEKSAASQL